MNYKSDWTQAYNILRRGEPDRTKQLPRADNWYQMPKSAMLPFYHQRSCFVAFFKAFGLARELRRQRVVVEHLFAKTYRKGFNLQ